MPSTRRDTVMTTTDVARSFFAAYNHHDVNRMLAECSDDAQVRYVPMGDQGTGPARDVGKNLWSGLIDAFPDLSVTVPNVFGDDRNMAAEVVIGGTQRKDYMGIQNQGKHYELPQAFIMRVDDEGLIANITAYWDNASFYSQLGKTSLA